MGGRGLAGPGLRVIAVPLLMAALAAGASPGAAPAAACVSWTGVQPPNPSSSSNFLNGVAVVSSCRAWAVGSYFNGTAFQTLIDGWDGASWTQQPSPNPAGARRGNELNAVAATSASNAWAVGIYSNGTAYQTLTEHWNGTIWAQVPSPSPSSSGDNLLSAVAATSASNAWAVGSYSNGTADQTLIERWNGTTWKRVPSPNPGGSARFNVLRSVAATSATSAWAVGYYSNGTAEQTLIVRWDGTTWKRVPSPSPSSSINRLAGVTATSATSAWAVGTYDNGIAPQTLIERWNGTAWKRVPGPNPGSANNAFLGVTATSATSAWAVGAYQNGTVFRTLIGRWNGTAWTQVPSPNLSSSDNFLQAVDATSATSAWAVGYYHTGTGYRTMALHCC